MASTSGPLAPCRRTLPTTNGVVVVTWAAVVVVGTPKVVTTPVLVGPAVVADVGVAVVADVGVVVVGVVDEEGCADVVAVGTTVVGVVVDDSDWAPTERADHRTVEEVTAKVTRTAAVTRRFANRWFIGDIEGLVSEAMVVSRTARRVRPTPLLPTDSN